MKDRRVVPLSGSANAEIAAAVAARGPEPCVVCGAFPPARYGALGAELGSLGAERLDARFGTAPAGKRRVIVYYVCDEHSGSDDETLKKIEAAIFSRGLN